MQRALLAMSDRPRFLWRAALRVTTSAAVLCVLALHTWRRAKRSLITEPKPLGSSIGDGVSSCAAPTTGVTTAESTPVIPCWATGELIRLSASASGLSLTVVVEERRSRHRGAVAISLPGSPFARLRVTSEETVDFGGKGDGDDTLWVATDPTSLVTGLTHASKGNGGSSYALVATRGGLAVRRRSSSGEVAGGETIADSVWCVAAVSRGGPGEGCRRVSAVPAATPPTRPAQRLQPSQLAAFVRDGCLVLPNLVPAAVLLRAQTAVNARLGRPGGLSLFYDEARKVVPHARRTVRQLRLEPPTSRPAHPATH